MYIKMKLNKHHWRKKKKNKSLINRIKEVDRKREITKVMN